MSSPRCPASGAPALAPLRTAQGYGVTPPRSERCPRRTPPALDPAPLCRTAQSTHHLRRPVLYTPPDDKGSMCRDQTLPNSRGKLPASSNVAWAAQPSVLTLAGATFRLTSPACPEQYMVDLGDAENRGYVRLRHGALTADYLPDGDFGRAVQVFEYDIGDYAGCFESNEERDEYLTRIAGKLHRHHRAHASAAGDAARPPEVFPRRETTPGGGAAADRRSERR